LFGKPTGERQAAVTIRQIDIDQREIAFPFADNMLGFGNIARASGYDDAVASEDGFHFHRHQQLVFHNQHPH